MEEVRLAFTTKLGFHILFEQKKSPLLPGSISKVTSKFVDALVTSPYFAMSELQELSALSYDLEREELKKRPNPKPLIEKIVVWFSKSQVRQNQLKEWLRSAPELFVSEILRSQNFSVMTKL
jgi:hypothetical protein